MVNARSQVLFTVEGARASRFPQISVAVFQTFRFCGSLKAPIPADPSCWGLTSCERWRPKSCWFLIVSIYSSPLLVVSKSVCLMWVFRFKLCWLLKVPVSALHTFTIVNCQCHGSTLCSLLKQLNFMFGFKLHSLLKVPICALHVFSNGSSHVLFVTHVFLLWNHHHSIFPAVSSRARCGSSFTVC